MCSFFYACSHREVLELLAVFWFFAILIFFIVALIAIIPIGIAYERRKRAQHDADAIFRGIHRFGGGDGG